MSDHDRLQEETDALPREIEPSRDLWPEIEARVAPASAAGADTDTNVDIPRRRIWRTEFIAAAAALVVFIAGWGVAKLGPGLDPGAGEFPAGDVATADPGPTAADLDADYAAASQQLMQTLEEGGLSPETVDQIRRDLATMDTAVLGFRDALEQRPDDPRLQRQLTDEVRRRGSVLRRIAGIQIAGLQLGGNQ